MPTKLTPTQHSQVFRWITGKDPRQYGLDIGLWARQIAATLIEERSGIHLGVTSLRWARCWHGWASRSNSRRNSRCNEPANATPKPSNAGSARLTPRSPDAARQSEAGIYFCDESGFRADTVHGKTWAPKGKTPVIEQPGQRQSIPTATAVNAKGGFWFQTDNPALNAELFIEPGYAPVFKPDELVWSHVKRTGVARNPLRAGEKLEIQIDEQLRKMQRDRRLTP